VAFCIHEIVVFKRCPLATEHLSQGVHYRAISTTLCQTHHRLSANEVRRSLVEEEFDLSDYSKPLATISTTLRRLAAIGRVEATRPGRNVSYKWIGDR